MSLLYSSNIPVAPGVLSHQSAVRNYISSLDTPGTNGTFNYWAIEGGEASHTTLTVSTLIAENITTSNLTASNVSSINAGFSNLYVPFDGYVQNLSTQNLYVNGITTLNNSVNINSYVNLNNGLFVYDKTGTTSDFLAIETSVSTSVLSYGELPNAPFTDPTAGLVVGCSNITNAVFTTAFTDLSGADVRVNTINGSAYPPAAVLTSSNLSINSGSIPATAIAVSGNPATTGTPLLNFTGLSFFQAGSNYLVDIPITFNATTSINQPISLGVIVGTGIGSQQVFETLTLINGGGVSGYQYEADITGIVTVGPFNTGVMTIYAYNTDPANTPTVTGIASTRTAYFYAL